MRYLCLIYENERQWESLTPAESEAIMGECVAFTEGIRSTGKLVASEALQPTATAVTVRVRNGKISTTDGPYIETKEQLGGFYVIDTQDLNEAIQTAARIPSARRGAVEVRPVVDFSQEMAAASAGQQGAKAWVGVDSSQVCCHPERSEGSLSSRMRDPSVVSLPQDDNVLDSRL